MTKTKAFGIFEGGGAKGLAHAGALKAAEERFQFIGVAGTSAGAIVASLIAAGFGADEIYSPDNEDAILNKDLTVLLDPKEWSSLKSIRDRASKPGSKSWTAFNRIWKLRPSLQGFVFGTFLLVLLVCVVAVVLFSFFSPFGSVFRSSSWGRFLRTSYIQKNFELACVKSFDLRTDGWWSTC